MFTTLSACCMVAHDAIRPALDCAIACQGGCHAPNTGCQQPPGLDALSVGTTWPSPLHRFSSSGPAAGQGQRCLVTSLQSCAQPTAFPKLKVGFADTSKICMGYGPCCIRLLGRGHQWKCKFSDFGDGFILNVPVLAAVALATRSW